MKTNSNNQVISVAKRFYCLGMVPGETMVEDVSLETGQPTETVSALLYDRRFGLLAKLQHVRARFFSVWGSRWAALQN